MKTYAIITDKFSRESVTLNPRNLSSIELVMAYEDSEAVKVETFEIDDKLIDGTLTSCEWVDVLRKHGCTMGTYPMKNK